MSDKFMIFSAESAEENISLLSQNFNLGKTRPSGGSFRSRFNSDDSGKEMQDHLEKIFQFPFELSETIYDCPIYTKANGRFGNDCIHNFLEMDLFEYLTYLYEGSSFRMNEFIFIQLLSLIVNPNPNPNTIRVNIDNSFHFLEGSLKRQLPKNGFYLRLNDEAVINFMDKICSDHRGVFLTGLGNGQYLGLTISGPKMMNIEDWAQFYIDSFMEKTEGKYDSWISFYYKSKRLYQWRLYGKMTSGETGHKDYGIDVHIESFKLPPRKWNNIKIDKNPKEKEIIVFKKRVSSNHFKDSLDRFHRNMIQVEGERQEDYIPPPFFYGNYDECRMTTASGTIRNAFGGYAIDDNRYRFHETPGISTIRQLRANLIYNSKSYLQWNMNIERQVLGRFRRCSHTNLYSNSSDINPETNQFTEENRLVINQNEFNPNYPPFLQYNPIEYYQTDGEEIGSSLVFDEDKEEIDNKQEDTISSSTLSYGNQRPERGYCVHHLQNLNLISPPRNRFQDRPLRTFLDSLFDNYRGFYLCKTKTKTKIPNLVPVRSDFIDPKPYSMILYLSRYFLNNPRPRKRRRKILAITNEQ